MKLELAWNDAMKEQPTHVVFNGRVGALTEPDNMLQVRTTHVVHHRSRLLTPNYLFHQVNTGERVRIYFGAAPPPPSLFRSFPDSFASS
jgi:hypothetical protein